MLKTRKILSALAVVIIAVVLAVIINVGIFIFYAPRQLDNICPNAVDIQTKYNNKISCEVAGGFFEKIGGQNFCNFSLASCNTDYRVGRIIYNRNITIILIVTALIFFALRLLVKTRKGIANLLLVTGILIAFVGVIRYWLDINEYLESIAFFSRILLWIINGGRGNPMH